MREYFEKPLRTVLLLHFLSHELYLICTDIHEVVLGLEKK